MKGVRLLAGSIALLAAALAPAEPHDRFRPEIERDQAARRLELKLDQLRFERRRRLAPSTGLARSPSRTAPRGTRLPLSSIASDVDAAAGGAAVAERRRLRSLFDREQFRQRQLQRKHQRSTIGDRGRFRMEERQQLRRFRAHRRLGTARRSYRR